MNNIPKGHTIIPGNTLVVARYNNPIIPASKIIARRFEFLVIPPYLTRVPYPSVNTEEDNKEMHTVPMQEITMPNVIFFINVLRVSELLSAIIPIGVNTNTAIIYDKKPIPIECIIKAISIHIAKNTPGIKGIMLNDTVSDLVFILNTIIKNREK